MREALGVAAGFLILTVLLTFPAVTQLSGGFLGDGGDAYVNVWNLWWVKTALLDLHTNPFHTDHLYWPTGTSLVLHTLTPFNGLLSIPLQLFLPLDAVYNLLVLFSFWAAGIGMYALARYLTGCRAASFLAGVIFTFCPYHFAHALGHLNLVATYFLPVHALFVLRTIDHGRARDAALASVALVLVALCSWYYLAYALLLTAVLAAGRWRDVLRSGRRAGLLALSVVGAGAVLSPLLLAMVAAGAGEGVEGHAPEAWSADVVSLFVPSTVSTWGRGALSGVTERTVGAVAESSNYLGYVVLALAGWGAVRVRRARFWVLAAGVFLVLSLGPHLQVMSQRVAPLPYLLLQDLPGFRLTGVPARFDVLVKLCLAVAAAFAVARWRAGAGGRGRWVTAVLVAAVCMEYLAVPFPWKPVRVPPFYLEIAKDPDHYGVLEVPRVRETMYLAAVHGKPIVGGYVSRRPVEAERFLRETAVLGHLAGVRPDRLPAGPDLERLAKDAFARHGVRYVVAHHPNAAIVLEQGMKLRLVDDRGGVRVYDTRR